MPTDKYIKMKTGAIRPKNPMKATESRISALGKAGKKQGKDYDIVSAKVLGLKRGGKVKKKKK
tara:strand:- start:420 stop:608 length:189 start_codon:yes stop_codon:yes gene_type:complete